MHLFSSFLITANMLLPTKIDKLCHIANAGFFIENGGNGVLIDTVIDQGLEGYVQPSKPLLAKIEKGLKPFNNVKLVLITHYHADHFDPISTLRHLRHNPDTQYIMPPQAYEMIKKAGITDHETMRIHTPLPDMDGEHQTLEISDIKTDIYRISHGVNRPIENLGYKVSFPNLSSIYHPGDMSTTTEQLNSVGLNALPVDYLLLPFWSGLDKGTKSLVDSGWKAKHIIPMHFQKENREWMQQYGGPLGVQKAAKAAWDNTVSLTGEMTCLPF